MTDAPRRFMSRAPQNARERKEAAEERLQKAFREREAAREAYWSGMRRLYRERFELQLAEAVDQALRKPPEPAVEWPLEPKE